MNRRFLIASGGTGGHFYPGFALGKLLNKQGCSVLFIVRKNDPAAQVLEDNKLKFKEVDFMGLPRSLNPFKYIQFFFKLLKALRQTRGIIRQFRPDVAVGTGGYISFPLIFTAHLSGVKTAVHDSNTKIGLANKICGKFTDLFMLGLPVSQKIKNSVLTSTPIRAEFADKTDRSKILRDLELDPAKKTVLVFGGSQGAKGLNAAIINAVRRLTEENPHVHFIHITGERWYSVIRTQYGKLPGVKVLPYSHEIYELMQISDLAVCRSGASTLAELIYCQTPAVLVPFPHAAANHQYFNAKILEEAGCALLVEEGARLQERLYEAMSRVLSSPDRLKTMHNRYAQLEIPNPIDAAQRIAQLLKKL